MPDCELRQSLTRGGRASFGTDRAGDLASRHPAEQAPKITNACRSSRRRSPWPDSRLVTLETALAAMPTGSFALVGRRDRVRAAGTCGRLPGAAVVHRLRRLAPHHSIGCPQCPQPVSTGSGQRSRRLRCPACTRTRQARRARVDAALRPGLLDRRGADGLRRDRRLGRLPRAAGGAVGLRRRGTGRGEPHRRGGRLRRGRRQRAAADPRRGPGRGRRPARRRRCDAGLLVGGDRRGRGDRPLHPPRGDRVRLALPRRGTAGAPATASARAPPSADRHDDGPRPRRVGGRRTGRGG